MLDVYANGLCYCSVCTDLPLDEIPAAVNMANPSGVTRWTIADEPFRSGAPNPSPCDQYPDRKHYLMVC